VGTLLLTILRIASALSQPRHGNDRLLLGLKGSLNEYELDLLRQRSLSARYEKARRGELVVSAPVGLVPAWMFDRAACPHPPRRRPNYATIHRMIDNPIYGGAYAYGKTASASGYSADGISVKIRRKARTDWLALMPNAHEGYV
jgi:DNA invertase Pin-like site-specific DNA recombinase